MDDMSTKKTSAEGNLGLFQFDVENDTVVDLVNYAALRFNSFLEENELANKPAWAEELFASGLRFNYDVRLWLEPGYYMEYDVAIRFSKVQTARKEGLYLAPYQLDCQTSFDYPLGCPRNIVQIFRFQWQEEFEPALKSCVVALNTHISLIFLSEVITR